MVKEGLWRCLGKADKAIPSSLGRGVGTWPLEKGTGKSLKVSESTLSPLLWSKEVVEWGR